MGGFMDGRGMLLMKPLARAEWKQPLDSVLEFKRYGIRMAPAEPPRPAPFKWGRPETSCVLYGQQEFLITHVWGSSTLRGGDTQDSPSIFPWSIID